MNVAEVAEARDQADRFGCEPPPTPVHSSTTARAGVANTHRASPPGHVQYGVVRRRRPTAPVGDLQQGLVTRTSGPTSTPDPYTQRILDSALRRFVTGGIRATSVEAIARTAEIDRATIYRRYPSKEQLLDAVLTRELQRLHTRISEATRAMPFDEQIIEWFALALRYTRAHPLLRRIRDTEPAHILAALAGRRLPDTVSLLLRNHPHFTAALGPHAPILVETFTRLAISLLTSPSQHFPVESHDQVRELAKAILLPAVHAHLTRARTPRSTRRRPPPEHRRPLPRTDSPSRSPDNGSVL
jgi:AcrR family transcriptional regulator